MTISDANVLSHDIADVMGDTGLARLHMGGAPVVISTCAPPLVVYASASACSLFGTRDLDALTLRLFSNGDAAGQRLAYLAARTGTATSLERLRFLAGGKAELLTFLCRSLTAPSGAAMFALAALGVRPALLRMSVPDAKEPPVTEPLPSGDTAEPVQPEPIQAEPVTTHAALGSTEPENFEPHETAPVAVPPLLRSAETAEPAGAAFDLARQQARPQRFSWRSDAQDKITDLPELLVQALGQPRQTLVGQSLHDVLAHLKIEPATAIATALDRRATWSGLETLWPIAETGELLPVVLGATPIFGAGQAFESYRGFGLMHFDRIKPAPPQPEAVALPEPPLVHVPGPQPAPEAEMPHHPMITQAELVLATMAEDEPGPGDLAGTIAEAHEAKTDAAHSAAAEISPCDEAGPASHSDSEKPELHPEPEPFAVDPAETSAAEKDAKIVRLRPLQGHLKLAAQSDKPELAALPVETEPPARAPANSLTHSERQAFSEIARSLTAKIKDSGPEIQQSGTRGNGRGPVAENANLPGVAAPEARAPQARLAASAGEGVGNLAHLLQRLPVGILVSRDAAPLLVNQHLTDMLGYADPHAFGIANGFARMFRGRQPEALDPAPDGGAIPLVAQNGDIVMAEARLQTVEWDHAPATLLTLRRAPEHDANARLRTLETELRQHEAEARELHAILDTATDGVAILDDNGRILSLNRSAEALFGHEQNEVAGEPFTVLIARDQQHQAQDYFEGIKTNGMASVLNDGREMLGRARQGGAIPLFITLGRVGPGTNPKFCAILRDLTQWKKVEGELGDARREAERASQLKSDFLAKISHEIRTPLNAILGFAEVMAEERLGPIGNERYKEYVHDIHNSGTHVMSLVNDLLDLSKIEAGKMELEFSSVDANRVVAECVTMMHPQAATDRVVMRLSLAPRLPNIVADERSLRQIVLNLLSNAVKFNEAGGQVIVSTALTDAGHAVVRIRDTGIGMTDTDVQAAMEPFRQLATARKKHGTGLGLPLTKALVEANRASFIIKSKKNEGTLVEVAFPPTRVLAE